MTQIDGNASRGSYREAEKHEVLSFSGAFGYVSRTDFRIYASGEMVISEVADTYDRWTVFGHREGPFAAKDR